MTNRSWLVKWFLGLLGAALLLTVFALSQETNPPVTNEPAWDSPQTRVLAQRACFDCHSNETAWPWYDKLPVGSWIAVFDTVRGRRALNFSEWHPGGRIREMAESIQGGSMPPGIYTMMHPNAILSAQEKQQANPGIAEFSPMKRKTLKAASANHRVWIECAVLAGLSGLLALFMNILFAPGKPTRVFLKSAPGDTPASPWDKAKPEEKAKAEPARRALDQATAEVDSVEKADRVAKRLEELAGSASTGEVEQAQSSGNPGTTSDKVADSSRRIEQAAKNAPPAENAAQGITQVAKEITTSPGRERAALAEATQETLNPDQEGAPGQGHPKQREYLRRAVLKRMKPFDALDAEIFLLLNHLPHNRWLNGFFRFFTLIFTGGLGWYLILIVGILVNPRKGLQVMRRTVLPLTSATSLVEFPIKAFFHRKRPFIAFIQAIVIGKKPGSWSFPSGHSASSFAGAWLLSRDFPRQSPIFFLLAGLVGFSRIYLGDHYPGDVLSGALSGMAIAESVQRLQQVVMHSMGSDMHSPNSKDQ